MSPALTFTFGLLLLVLFGWYFASDLPARKRWLGLVLTVLLAAFCIEQIVPPEKKIRLGLDCLLYTSPSPRDRQKSRMPSSA